MRKSLALSLLLPVLALAACSPPAPEAPKLDLQPIAYFDVTQNKLYGSGCNFVSSDGGMGAVFLAQSERGLIKLADHVITLPVARGAGSLPQGAHDHYAGGGYAATLSRVPDGKAKTMGVIDVFAARLVIADGKRQTLYDKTGDAQCKPM